MEIIALTLLPILMILFFFGLMALWIWMLIDAIKYQKDNQQIVWVLVIIFAQWIGAVLYYFMEYRKRSKA